MTNEELEAEVAELTAAQDDLMEFVSMIRGPLYDRGMHQYEDKADRLIAKYAKKGSGNLPKIFRTWLKAMFDEEIKQEQGTIDNEVVFRDGSTNQADSSMHEQNVDLHLRYLRVLEKLRAGVDNLNVEGA